MANKARDAAPCLPVRGIVAEDLLDCSWLEEVEITSSGHRIAYTVRRPDCDTNGYRVDVYVMDVDSRRSKRLTASFGRGGSLSWNRQGSRLAFVWREDGMESIVVVDEDGKPEESFSAGTGSVSGLDWAPDGTRLAMSRWTTAPRSDPARAPGIPEPTMRVVKRLRYKQEGSGWVENRYRQIWILHLDTSQWSQLTHHECDHTQPRWSWDGRRIAYVGTAREQNVALGYGQIFVHDFGCGLTELLIPEWRGSSLSPQWRADDKAIAFVGHDHGPPVHRRMFHHIWIYYLDEARAVELTGDLDQTVGNYAVSDQRPGLTGLTATWPGGRGPIHFLLTEKGATLSCSVSEQGDWKRHTGDKSVVFAYAPSERGRLAFGMAAPGSMGELYLQEHDRIDRLTDLNSWLASRELSEPEEYTYEGLDQQEAHGWIVKPVGFDEDIHYPMIAYAHCSMFSWDFNLEIQCLANAGFIVTYFNSLGTTAGYGQACALGNYYGEQEAEFAELMMGIDAVTSDFNVDESRMGITGGSCGGYMTNWTIGHTNRFAAAVTQRSISDLVSKFGTSDNGPEQATSEGADGPWVDVDLLWANSPLASAHRIETPLLIVHSDQDYRCALGQAEELFAALRWLGKEVELVIFEGEGHGLSRGGRPGNRIERINRIQRWFEMHLSCTW